MGGNNSKSQSGSETDKSSKPSDPSQNLSTKDIIRRLAIDQSAVIGSLYDARQDCFLKEPASRILWKPRPLKERTQCTMININEISDQTLSNLTGIDKDLCLSVKLNMAPQSELSSLINYPLVTNAPTRMLCYSYFNEEKYISDGQDIHTLNIPEIIRNITATHLVTGIMLGMIVVIVLELSPHYESHLNSILKNIHKQLTENTFNLTAYETGLLDQITSIKIFSNLPQLCELTKLVDVCQKITEIKSTMSEHRLLEYTLRPIRSLISSDLAEKYVYVPLTSQTINKIEQHFSQLLLIMKDLKISFTSDVEKLLQNHFKDQFNAVQEQISDIQKKYKSRIEDIRSMVLKMRSGVSQEQTVAEMQIGENEESLQNKIAAVNDSLRILQEKVQLIEHLKGKTIEYWNMIQIAEDHNHDLETIVKQIMKKSNRMRIFCFDDRLEKPHSPQWNQFYEELIRECESAPQLQFVYADFSFSLCQLSKMEAFSSKDINNQNSSQKEQPLKATSSTPKATQSSSKATPPYSNAAQSSSKATPPSPKATLSSSKATQSSSTATPPSQKKIRLEKPNQPIVNHINVLLLGESGLGKSTFVNALVNYLQFENLREARSGRPIVLMPVSFLMTVGDHFEEHMVRFGEKDPNEDYNHPGQSVTQHCRSYVFTIGTQTKIRLIDTPGMGDTRGLDQDDLNMQHILSFINNLSHLNAICILLKPNEARLNVVFRSYFTRLIDFLGENVRNNIIFCFTNTRGTFFAPGDTGPLLKKMLNSHSIKNIPFKKINTFCFDNESFRYLIALMDGIKFDDYQKEEYERSWITSVNESHRLLDYICSELNFYPQKNWHSIEHAHFQIIQLIRPMLETIRNTMRNMISLDKSSTKSLMKLHLTPVPTNSGLCLDCKHPERLGEFWILPDKSHVLSNRCDKCQCDLSRHWKVNYLLTYLTWIDRQKPSYNEMKGNLDRLKPMITEFVYFFKHVVRISKENDPILFALNRMIDEEKYICSQKGQNTLNLYLYNELKNLRKEYENIWTTSTSNQKSMTLSYVYEHIKNVSQNPTISQQLDVVKQIQEKYMSEQEKHVS